MSEEASPATEPVRIPWPQCNDNKSNEDAKKDDDIIRIVCISDTHQQHDRLVMPPGDILVFDILILALSNH
jgi:hypothetical protein